MLCWVLDRQRPLYRRPRQFCERACMIQRRSPRGPRTVCRRKPVPPLEIMPPPLRDSIEPGLLGTVKDLILATFAATRRPCKASVLALPLPPSFPVRGHFVKTNDVFIRPIIRQNLPGAAAPNPPRAHKTTAHELWPPRKCLGGAGGAVGGAAREGGRRVPTPSGELPPRMRNI